MLTVQEIVEYVLAKWQASTTKVIVEPDSKGCEAHTLKLDSSRANNLLDWHPSWNAYQALDSIVEWYQACYCHKGDMYTITTKQIEQFIADAVTQNQGWVSEDSA
jgi:CDP-glucose 4,6-dehydratase